MNVNKRLSLILRHVLFSLRGGFLIRFASREPPESLLYDPPGTVRVTMPWRP
jgi:hypothetical protein